MILGWPDNHLVDNCFSKDRLIDYLLGQIYFEKYQKPGKFNVELRGNRRGLNSGRMRSPRCDEISGLSDMQIMYQS